MLSLFHCGWPVAAWDRVTVRSAISVPYTVRVDASWCASPNEIWCSAEGTNDLAATEGFSVRPPATLRREVRSLMEPIQFCNYYGRRSDTDNIFAANKPPNGKICWRH